MLDFEQIFEKYREKNLSPLAQDSTDKIKAVKKTVLDFENYLRENVGGFDDAGKKKFEDALQDTTLEIFEGVQTADDIKTARNKAVLDFGNCLRQKNISIEVKTAVFLATLDYIVYNHLN